MRLRLIPIFLIPFFYFRPSFSDYSAQLSMGGPESIAFSRYQPVTGTAGMVVSDDEEASNWGAHILKQGGNAIDAAVATAFVLAVTRPHYATLGGGGFILYCPQSKNQTPTQCQALDYREKSPKGAKTELFSKPSISINGALAVGVPGTPAGLLDALEKWGSHKISRQSILSRPIELAEQGYRLTTHTESALYQRWDAMNNTAKKIFGCNSSSNKTLKPCAPGVLIVQKDLAKVLHSLAKSGKNAFYQGPVALQLVKGIQAGGGVLTLDDLERYAPTLRKPLQGSFFGFEVIGMPLPSSGGILILELLEFAKLANEAGEFANGFGSVSAIRAITDGMSLAFADRAEFLGDPDFNQTLQVDHLISEKRAKSRWTAYQKNRSKLSRSSSNRILPPEPHHTTHLSVMDREGNAVSLTTTINDNFGSGFMPPETGVILNNVMDDFSIHPGMANLFGLTGGNANTIAPFKTPLSSMTPTILRDKNGRNKIIIGAAGGPRIITSVFQTLLNRILFEMTLTDAVQAPRVHHQWNPGTLFFEKFGLPLEIVRQLRKKGLVLEETNSLGKIHAIEKLKDERVLGVADLRGEGRAVAE